MGSWGTRDLQPGCAMGVSTDGGGAEVNVLARRRDGATGSGVAGLDSSVSGTRRWPCQDISRPFAHGVATLSRCRQTGPSHQPRGELAPTRCWHDMRRPSSSGPKASWHSDRCGTGNLPESEIRMILPLSHGPGRRRIVELFLLAGS